VSVDAWLAGRAPAPPAALAERLRALAAAHAPSAEGGAAAADALLVAAEDVLRRLLREGCGARQSALDLLVADALATYAFEAAAEDPAELPARAERAMIRIAALADAETTRGVRGRAPPGGEA